MTNNNPVKNSFIISYYEYTDKDRNNLKKLLEYLSWILDNQTEIVLVEQGFEPQIDWLNTIKNNHKINHVFLKSYRIFNKGWGYNVGVNNAKGHNIILHDTDTYLRLKSYKCSWMLNKFDIIKPYNRYVELNENDSDKFLINYNYNVILGKSPITNNNIAGGVVMINKNKYLSIKGFDETIVSYNYQKITFDIKVKKFELKVNTYNDSCINITRDNIFLSKDIFMNDKYLSYLYNDLETYILKELLYNIKIGLNEQTKFDYDGFLLNKPISIIITAFKTHEYIESCLNSIENQSYFKNNDYFEVLLGIDFCEETLNKVMEIRHKYRNLRVFMMDENKGTYITTNTLIDIAKYDNILRFDSDDIMKENMIKNILPYIERYNSVVFKFINFKMIDGKKITYETKEKHAQGILLFKKYLMDILGGYQPWTCAADTELFIRGKGLMDTKIIDKVLFERRIHPESLTRRDDVGLKSSIRQQYRNLIGKHESVKIDKVKNKYKEIYEKTENINCDDILQQETALTKHPMVDIKE